MILNKLNKREINTLNGFVYEIEKNQLLRDLFNLGYRNKDKVYALLKVYLAEYNSIESENRFNQFWLGRVKDDVMINHLQKVLMEIKSK